MIDIIAGKPVIKPIWTKCPKCQSDKVIVKQSGHYEEIHILGVFSERAIKFEGDPVTACFDCGFKENQK